MTQLAIKAEVATIKAATEKASKSKDSARKFLVAAGILDKKDAKKKTEKKY